MKLIHVPGYIGWWLIVIGLRAFKVLMWLGPVLAIVCTFLVGEHLIAAMLAPLVLGLYIIIFTYKGDSL